MCGVTLLLASRPRMPKDDVDEELKMLYFINAVQSWILSKMLLNLQTPHPHRKYG